MTETLFQVFSHRTANVDGDFYPQTPITSITSHLTKKIFIKKEDFNNERLIMILN